MFQLNIGNVINLRCENLAKYRHTLIDVQHCWGSLERTHQTTVGAILVDSRASVAMYRFAKKIHT